MGKHYCDYCDVYLTHDSTSVRKDHNTGRNHLQNVRDYYVSLDPAQNEAIYANLLREYDLRGLPHPVFIPPVQHSNFGGGGFRPPFGRPAFNSAYNRPPPPMYQQQHQQQNMFGRPPPNMMNGGPPPPPIQNGPPPLGMLRGRPPPNYGVPPPGYGPR